jgi:rhodanese-related sulfurtransferase
MQTRGPGALHTRQSNRERIMPLRSLLDRIFPSSGGSPAGAAAPRWTDVTTLHEALRSPQPPTVVDVRNPDEVSGPLGAIPGALNLPLGELPARMAELEAARKQPVVLVCLSDKRSAAAAGLLQQAAFTDVQVLRGGMQAWRKAGY